MKQTLTSFEKVSDFIDKSDKENSYDRIERIKEYKEFEKDLYKSVIEKEQSIYKLKLMILKLAFHL